MRGAEKVLDKEFTYDKSPNVSRMVKFIISVRGLYADCTTIVVMCHNKDHDEPGMEWLLGAVERNLTRCQIVVNKSNRRGVGTKSNGEIWGLLYLDAKTAPDWSNEDHPPIWLQPIAFMAARTAFEGKKDIMASDNDQVPAALGNLNTWFDRHVKPIANYPQARGEASYYLVCEPTILNNCGLRAMPKTSDAARKRGGSNTMFEGITTESADQLLMEAGAKDIAQDPDDRWPTASNLSEFSEHAEKKAWANLPLSFKVGSTNDIAMTVIAMAVSVIANFYPAEDPDKRKAIPRGISDDAMVDLAPHCDWAHVGSEQAAAGLLRVISNPLARVITLPASTTMTNELPKFFSTQINGIVYQVFTIMMPASLRAYGKVKAQLRKFDMPTIMPSYAEVLQGADTFCDAYQVRSESQVSRNRGVDNCLKNCHAKNKT